MTLNTNFAGAALMPGRGRLEGTERGLDGLIGLVIVIAGLLIGALSVFALFVSGEAYVASDPGASDLVSIGFGIALFGSAIIMGVSIIVYLIRIATGRRSWPAPLWGVILMTVVLFVGYLVMAA